MSQLKYDADHQNEQQDELVGLDDLCPEDFQHPQRWLKRYPWIRQHDATDCGPTCMAMISKFYKRKIAVREWRSAVFTNREGTSLFELARGAEKFGFNCEGISVPDFTELPDEFLPCVVLRQSHCLVVYEINSDSVLLGDPAVGLRKMTHGEFAKGLTPVALVMKPTEKFFALQETKQTYTHYLQFIKGLRFEFLMAFICTALFVALSLVPPLLNQYVFDHLVGGRHFNFLITLLLAGFAVLTVQGFVSWTRNYYTHVLTAKIDFKTKNAFAEKIFSLPYTFFAVRTVGDFTTRMTELEKVRAFVTANLFGVVLNVSMVAIYVGTLFFYSGKIGFTVLGLVPGFFLISMIFTKKFSAYFTKIFVAMAEQDGLLADLIRGIAAIKSSGAESSGRARFEKRLNDTIQTRYNGSLTSAGLSAIVESYLQFAKLVVLGYGASLAMNGELTMGQVIAITMISSQIFSPLYMLTSLWPQIQELKISLDRLNDVFLTESEKVHECPDQKAGLKLEKLRGDIEFRDVWFRYGSNDADWSLQAVSFAIKAGQSIAVVGPSGSGKSTIAHLLTRLYEPTLGTILIDGRDYRDYDVTWLRSQIGIVLQESHLFSGTILENIAFSTMDPSKPKAIVAAKMAAAHDFIQQKPEGYDYHLNHGGFGLSGGEKQRIGMARALYNAPQVLILDEATSALDGKSEAKLLTNLKTGRPNETMMSITHRFTTVAASDFVLLLEQGQVVAFGKKHQVQNHILFQELFGSPIDAPSENESNAA